MKSRWVAKRSMNKSRSLPSLWRREVFKLLFIEFLVLLEIRKHTVDLLTLLHLMLLYFTCASCWCFSWLLGSLGATIFYLSLEWLIIVVEQVRLRWFEATWLRCVFSGLWPKLGSHHNLLTRAVLPCNSPRNQLDYLFAGSLLIQTRNVKFLAFWNLLLQDYIFGKMIDSLSSWWSLVYDGGVCSTDTLSIGPSREVIHVCRRVLGRLWNASSWNQGLNLVLVAIIAFFVDWRLFLIFQRQSQLGHQLRLGLPFVLHVSCSCLNVINHFVARDLNCLVIARCEEGLSTRQVSVENLSWWPLIITIWSRNRMGLIEWITHKLLGRLIKKSLYFLNTFPIRRVQRWALVDFLLGSLDFTLTAACPKVVLTRVDTAWNEIFCLGQIDAACRHTLLSKWQIVRLVFLRLVTSVKLGRGVLGWSASTLNQLLNSLVVKVWICLCLQLSQLRRSARRRPVLGITCAWWLLPFVTNKSSRWANRLLLTLNFLRCSIFSDCITSKSVWGIPCNLMLIRRRLTSADNLLGLRWQKLRQVHSLGKNDVILI